MLDSQQCVYRFYLHVCSVCSIKNLIILIELTRGNVLDRKDPQNNIELEHEYKWFRWSYSMMTVSAKMTNAGMRIDIDPKKPAKAWHILLYRARFKEKGENSHACKCVLPGGPVKYDFVQMRDQAFSKHLTPKRVLLFTKKLPLNKF